MLSYLACLTSDHHSRCQNSYSCPSPPPLILQKRNGEEETDSIQTLSE